MVNISNVMSVVSVMRIPAKEWHECGLTSLKSFFAKHGNVLPTSSGERVEQSPDQPPNEVFLQPTGNCGHAKLYNKLCCEHNFFVFSASCVEAEGQVALKFMLCPDYDINWDRPRPFKEMTEAFGRACSMAGLRTKGYNNQYLKAGRETDHMRSVSINADQPNWLLKPDGQPITKEGGAAKKAKNQLTIADDGEVKLV